MKYRGGESMSLPKLCRFLFTVLFTVLAVSAWAQSGSRYALVIGNAEYQRIDKLKNTVNDAEDISAALRGLGYQVELKRNLGHLDMVDAIEAFAVKLAGNRANEGFFWYAGHAVQIRDENYLLPVDVTVDTESRVRAGSCSLNNLIESLDGARNKVNVLILDACRDNPLPAAGRGGGGRGLAMIREVPSDLFVMFSTAPGDKADDGAAGKRNSPFAEAFLKYIKSNEPVYQMAIDVTQETLSLTGQRQRPFQRGSIISEKYYSLNPQAGQAATQPAQSAPAQNPAPAAITPAPVVTDQVIQRTPGEFEYFIGSWAATVEYNRSFDTYKINLSADGRCTVKIINDNAEQEANGNWSWDASQSILKISNVVFRNAKITYQRSIDWKSVVNFAGGSNSFNILAKPAANGPDVRFTFFRDAP
jgi:hypothetical protein